MTQPGLSGDLRRAFGARILNDDALAADIYRALCNNEWVHQDGTHFTTTWRGAAELVADLRRDEQGPDYYYYYYYWSIGKQGLVAPAIQEALARLGWTAVELDPRFEPP